MDISLLGTLVEQLVCPGCRKGNTLFIDEDHNKRRGLASYISVCCHSCDYMKLALPKQLVKVELEVVGVLNPWKLIIERFMLLVPLDMAMLG